MIPSSGMSGYVIVTIASSGPQLVQRYYAEVAKTPDEQARGLSGRDSIPGTGGMLFPFDPPRVQSFWMRNTRVALDIIWISPRMMVVGVERMEPNSEEPHVPAVPVAYALELLGGQAGRDGIRQGAGVTIEPVSGSEMWPFFVH